MNIECNEIEYCKMSASYTADIGKVATKRTEACNALRKEKVKVSGYRPGKAPDYAIKIKMKKQLDQWVTREMANEAFQDVLFETKIKPMGQPLFQRANLSGDSFSCDLTFWKKPSFELNLTEFQVPKPAAEMTVDEYANQMLQSLREAHADLVPITDGVIESGDKITCDLEISSVQYSFRGMSGSLYTVSKNDYPQLDSNLIGMHPGETKSFSIIVSVDELSKLRALMDDELKDSLPNEPLEIFYKITIHAGLRVNLAPLDDTLAVKAGMNTFDELSAQCRSLAEHRINYAEKNKIRQQIILQLLDRHQFEVPSFFVTQEAMTLTAKNGKPAWNTLSDQDKEPLLALAKDNLRMVLIMDSIREAEPTATLSESEVLAHLETLLEQDGKTLQEGLQLLQQSGKLHETMAKLKDEATLQWVVLSKTKIVE